MQRRLFIILFALVCLLGLAAAQNTVSGTTITNTATATFTDASGTDRTATSNTVETTVQIVYSFNIEPDATVDPSGTAASGTDWSLYTQDGLNQATALNPGASDVAFSYTVTNNTNNDATSADSEAVTLELEVLQASGTDDDFDMTNIEVYTFTDNNSDGLYNAGDTLAATPLFTGTGSGTLTFDQQGDSYNVVVFADVPSTGVNAGDVAYFDLVATNTSPSVDASVTDANELFENNNVSEVQLNEIDLSTTVTADDDNPQTGGSVTLTVETSNAGPDTATGVETTVTLPDGLSGTVTVTDGAGNTLTEGTDYTATTDANGVTTIVFTGDTVASGDSVSYEITTTVEATFEGGADTPGQSLDVTAEVTDAVELDSDSTPADGAGDDYATETLTVQSADISISKTAEDGGTTVTGSVTGGDTFDYIITVTNNGPNNATGIEVEDVLPGGVSVNGTITASEGTATNSSGTITWTGVALNYNSATSTGESATLTIPVIVDAGFNGAINNTATVTASGPGDPDDTNDDANFNLNSVAVDLEVTDSLTFGGSETSDTTVSVNSGDSLTYSFEVDNAASNDATNVEATVTLPDGVTYTSTTGTLIGSPTVNADGTTTLVFDVGTVAGNGSAGPIDIVVSIDDVSDVNADTLVNDADTDLVFFTEITDLDQSDSDSTPDNGTYPTPAEDDEASEMVDVGLIDLELTETVAFVSGTGSASAPNPGDTLTYTIDLNNNGPDTATGVAMQDLLPEGLTIQSIVPAADANSSAGTSTSSGQTVSYTGITVASGESVSYTVTVTVDEVTDLDSDTDIDADDATLTSAAQVTAADQFDVDSTPESGALTAPLEDDEDTNTINVGLTDVAITAYSVSDTSPDAGDTITYSITLTNQSGSDATGLELADVLPDGVTYVSISDDNAGSVVTYDGGTDTVSVDGLDAGESVTITVTVTVDDAFADTSATFGETISHTVEITDLDQTDSDSTPNNAVATEDDIASVSFTVENPVIGAAKEVLSIAQPANSAAAPSATNPYTVTLAFYLENLGTVDLQNVGLTDDLDAVFGAGNYALKTSDPANGSVSQQNGSGTGVTPTIDYNTGFNGGTTTQLLVTGSSTLPVGHTATLTLVVEVYSDGTYNNTAVASAQDANGNPVSDDSTDGTNPDGDGDGDPTDESVATPIRIGTLELVKTVRSCADAACSTVVDATGAEVAPGQYLEYTVTGTNSTSDQDFTDVVIYDQIPSGTQYAGRAGLAAGTQCSTTSLPQTDPSFAATFGACPTSGSSTSITWVRRTVGNLSSGSSSALVFSVFVP